MSKVLTLHFMMQKVTAVGKGNILALSPGCSNLLSLLRGHGRPSLRIARKEQDGTPDVLNRCAPGRGRRNGWDKIEHSEIELCLGLQMCHQLFFRPVKCARWQESLR